MAVSRGSVIEVIPVGAPARIRTLLSRSPDGAVPVVHRGRDAIYVEVGGQCVGVLGRHAVAVPCGLRSREETLAATGAALVGGVLHLDERPVVIGRIVDVAVPGLSLRDDGARAGRWTGDRLDHRTDLRASRWVEHTIGRGEGLTPYQDDVWCGWLATHRAAGLATPLVDQALRATAHRTTLLSATLLECAMRGEVIPEFAAYLTALDTPAEAESTARLLRIGHTSGRGMLHGARRALTCLRGASALGPTTPAAVPSPPCPQLEANDQGAA